MQTELPNTEALKPSSAAPKNRKLLIIIVALLVILTGISGYWYWTRTPQYSLDTIRNAIVNHDVILFEKHVDLDSLLSSAIDQAVEAKLKDKNEVQDEGMNNMAAGFLKMLQPQLIAAAKDEIKAFIEKGNFDSQNTTASEQQNKQQDTAKFSPKNFMQDSGYGNPEFKGIDRVQKSGNLALIGLKLFYPKLNHEIILDLKMREMDGYWRLTEIQNLSAVLLKLEEQKHVKLDEINKPLSIKIGNAVEVIDLNAHLINGPAFSQYIRFDVETRFLSEKPVVELDALITIKDPSGKLLLKFPVKATGLSATPGRKTLAWKKEINPFIASDQSLVKNEPGVLDAEIQYLKFADGTEIRLADKLP